MMWKSRPRRLFGFNRRDFLRIAPAGVAAGVLPGVAESQPSNAITTNHLRSASELADLEFTEIEHELMRGAIRRNRERYATLRNLPIPSDTEPALTFQPFMSGDRPTGGATPQSALPIRGPELPDVPDNIEDLALQPVTVLSRLVERREVTSTDLTTMYLNRLNRYGDTLNCVITLTPELALLQAARADQEIQTGRYRGPLHGIPWGAKDLLATRGVRTTWGAKPYEFQIIDSDATVVQRLQDAGAVLVAKLSMGALAQGGVWFGGSTRNPWDVSRSSSGSSAGPAAATAAGLVGFSIGTETLGSIISPSNACGVAGLRPTYGRVSRHGAMALSWTMDKIGPMCRGGEDCALVFNSIYGSDGYDETVVDAPFLWDTGFQVSRLRVGYIASELDLPPNGTSSEQRRLWLAQREVLQEALSKFRELGVALEPIELPDFPADALRLILDAEAATAFDDLTRTRGIDDLTRQGPGAWPNRFRSARFIPATEYIRAQRARTLLGREMAVLMTDYDAFVSPTLSQSLVVTNLTGHPAVAIKAGFRDGLPVGLMITGRLYEESTILQLAAAYEQVTPWHTMHPGDFDPF